MKRCNELEAQVIALLLEGEHPVLAVLRKQFAVLQVVGREATGVGFYTTFALPMGIPVLLPRVSLKLGDVEAEIGGLHHGAGFLLYIERGRLHMLEGYSFEEPWPACITGFRLHYTSGEGRDWDGIRRLLGQFEARA